MSVVCLCKGIEEEVIIAAIKDGAKTVEEVGAKTGTGTGFCKGSRCKAKIEKLIEEN